MIMVTIMVMTTVIDHGDDKGHDMHMEGDASATGMMSDGTTVSVYGLLNQLAGERMQRFQCRICRRRTCQP